MGGGGSNDFLQFSTVFYKIIVAFLVDGVHAQSISPMTLQIKFHKYKPHACNLRNILVAAEKMQVHKTRKRGSA